MRELSLHILDIAENSLRAGADLIKIVINEDSNNNLYQIYIEDNGSGMSDNYLSKVLDPFVTQRETRKIGLGLPLFKQTVEMCDGEFSIKSKVNQGTIIDAKMKRDHIDMPPMGSIIDTIITLVLTENECDIEFTHKYNQYKYVFSTNEVKSKLDGVKITESHVINWIKSYLVENERDLKKRGALL
jgi:anti-sigma regulatory factor (Ser/Thr protein kinase)